MLNVKFYYVLVGGRDGMLINGCSGGFMSGPCGGWWGSEGVGGAVYGEWVGWLRCGVVEGVEGKGV